MAKIDLFTSKRILNFVETFRSRSGQLPTLKDFESAGFSSELIDLCVREKILEQFYVTLTSGTIVKTFRARSVG